MEQIGKYKVLGHIGHGAMGSVEKAEAPDGTIVAIKTLYPQFVFEEEYLKRFKREAELARKLSHPNVVKIIEVGEDNDGRRQYIVMEYVDGRTLAECMHDKGMASVAIKRSSKLNEKDEAAPKNKKSPKKAPVVTTFSPEETIKIVRQLAGVLQAADDISLLHRDVKPQNILLDKKGNAKLLDFGLAKDTEALVSMLSMTGQSIGTPPYMSPEQHDGQKDIDIRSDLYSLGCTAYHMLTGKAPFPGPTASAFARQHCDDIPEPVYKINPECPLNLSQVIDRLLAKKPKNRHHNPAELIEDLNRVERGEVPLKLYKPKKSKKHSPLRNWLTVAVAVIIVAACFYGRDSYRRNNAKTIIAEALSDARELAVEHKFKQAKNVLDDIISEYAGSNPEQAKKAEDLRTKLIEQQGKWIANEALRKRQEKGTELTRSETVRKRTLHNCLRNAARLKNQESHVRKAEVLINKAYQLCNTDAERAKVSILEKKVQEALIKMRPWAAVADFTLDKSVEAKLTGSAVAVKLEQALGRKYRLVTRNQVKKALKELRFQSSDLTDKSKAKQFGKLVGAEYLISGSVIQLGREITVACQIFSIETGAIRQTAEVSASDVNDFNYMIRDAAKILAMSNADKEKYVEKLNSSKRTSGGKYPKVSQDIPGKKENRIIPGLDMKFVYVAPGSFMMGSNNGNTDEKPVHRVTISKGYWIGKYEVTQSEYQKIMGTNPSHFKGPDKPVETVSWNDAENFCKKLTERERKAGRLPPGYTYQLPTEAEWEFAARGGTKSRGYKYSGSDNIDSVAWYGSNSDNKTHEVGTKSGNELGIYDMSGNVWELCNGWYGKYSSNSVTPPKGASPGSRRVLRGGCWYNNARLCRVANRNNYSPRYADIPLGFRVALAPITGKSNNSKATVPKVVNQKPTVIQTAEFKPVITDDDLYDMDGDGFPNIFEFQQKTKMNKATSKPPMYMRLHLLEFKETLLPFQLMLVNTGGDKKDPADWTIQINETIKGKIKTRFKYLDSRMKLDKTDYTITKIDALHVDNRQGGSIVKIDKSKVYLKSRDGKYTITMQVGKPVYSPKPKAVIEDLGTGKMYHVGEGDTITMYLRAKAAVSTKTGKRLKRKITKYKVLKVDRQKNQVIIEEYKKTNPKKYVLTLKAFMPRPIKVVIKPKVTKPKLVKQVAKTPIIKNKTIPVLGMKLVYVAPGSFQMGSNNGKDKTVHQVKPSNGYRIGKYEVTQREYQSIMGNDKLVHQVKLSKGYWIGKYEVTQREYQSIMGTNPSKSKGSKKPVECVSWNDAVKFCEKLTSRERAAGRLSSGVEYRLPTEAEWEFAARGANKSCGYKYSGSDNIDSVAWYGLNSGKKTHEVGTKSSNELSIYDMSGNVYEWCLDDWHRSYNGAPSNGSRWGNGNGHYRVFRGGCWNLTATKFCRVEIRNFNTPSYRDYMMGFRVVLAPVIVEKKKIAVVNPLDKTIPELGLKLVHVKPGSFMMGSNVAPSSIRARPVHRVTISKGYWIGKYEVTQSEYQKIMGNNPSHFKGADKPVEQVSWHDAGNFCKKLTERERKAGRLPPGYTYQLPTEAEWEFAARGGKRGYVYRNSLGLSRVAWYSSNSAKQTHEVGTKSSNALGIHDMNGNVWEWCLDDCHTNYDKASSVANSLGETNIQLRVRRGGGWQWNFVQRTTSRSYTPSSRKYNYLGFRVALRTHHK